MTPHIGIRIRHYRRRRRGMTQEILAGLAGVDQPYISKVENGVKGVDRKSTLVAIAKALEVSVADLLGEPGDPTDPTKSGAASVVPAIRVILAEVIEGYRRPPRRTVEQMQTAVDEIMQLRAVSEYSRMAQALPDVLADAAGHGGLFWVQSIYATSVALRNLGHRDLALTAARQASGTALDVGHPGWLGAARFQHALALPVEAVDLTAQYTQAAVAELQNLAADPEARQMLGQLHLASAMACAVAGRSDDTTDHLRAAQAEADSLGDPADGWGFNLCSFGPTNVRLWKMAIDAENGDNRAVVALAKTFRPTALRVANRHQSYWMTFGRSLAASGRADDDAKALAAFTYAEQAAPVPFALSPVARDAVQSMMTRVRRRSMPTKLIDLAHRLGVDQPSSI